MVPDAARRAWQQSVPLPARLRIRRTLTNLPHRVRDAVPDFLERLSSRDPLPPAWLRRRVGLTSSRREFLEVGRIAAGGLLSAVVDAGCSVGDYPRWLDFGSGCGRVARHLGRHPAIRRLAGVDVDRDAIEWCRRNLAGDYRLIGSRPPLPMADESADVVFAVSVFTHMDEPVQREWLKEIHRVVRPGGLLVVSSHPPELTWTRPDLTSDQHRELENRGFLFAPAAGPFNDSSTFQSESFLRENWSGLFAPRLFRAAGLGGYQDLSVWERRSAVTARSDSSAASPPTAAD